MDQHFPKPELEDYDTDKNIVIQLNTPPSIEQVHRFSNRLNKDLQSFGVTIEIKHINSRVFWKREKMTPAMQPVIENALHQVFCDYRFYQGKGI